MFIYKQKIAIMEKDEVYESPSLERVDVFLEHAIAGSTDVSLGGNGFTDSWEEDNFETGDIELL